MKSQQQLHESPREDLQEFGQDEGPGLVTSRHSESKFAGFFIAIIFIIIGAVILIAFSVASSLEEPPKIHFSYQENAFLPTYTISEREKMTKERIKPLLDAISREVPMLSSSPLNLVNVESRNQPHRSYQSTMRQIESDNSHLYLEKHQSKLLSEDSALTYGDYLRAIDYLQLNTFPIKDLSAQLLKLQKQEREHYEQKYGFSLVSSQASICTVVELTHEGLQSGSYYYALKGLLQQDYKNHRVVVINKPDMGMLEDVAQLLGQFPNVNITLLDRLITTHSLPSFLYIQSSIHKYCKGTNMTILLRDTGELIGRQVFKTINKIYHSYKPPIIFTNYLLESSNPIRQTTEPFRYKVQLYAPNLANSRQQAYKTKYLKIYRSSLLLKIHERTYQNTQGQWIEGLFEAGLEFAMLELGCGEYYLLQEIMYKATKHDMENSLQVVDARSQNKYSCIQQEVFQSESITNKQTPASTHQETDKKLTFFGFEDIRNLTDNQIMLLKKSFREVFANRAIQYNNLLLKDNRKVDKSKISNESITPQSRITLEQVTSAVMKFQMNLRPNLYIEQMKKTIAKEPLQYSDLAKIDVKQTKPNNKPTPNNNIVEESTEFCVVLLTNNNYDQLGFLYTIQSVITQKYKKFRLVILDNKSTDLTAEIIKHHLTLISLEERKVVTLLQTSRSMHHSQLFYYAVKHISQPNEVMIFIQSGQEFIGKDVFKLLDLQYTKTQAFAVYTNTIYVQSDIVYVGPSALPKTEVIRGKKYRKQSMYFQKLQSYRSELVNKLTESDFKSDNGQWINQGKQQALGYAIEEQACENIIYLPQLLLRLPARPKHSTSVINKEISGFKYECFVKSGLKTMP